LTQLAREARIGVITDSAGRRLYDPDEVARFAAERSARRASQTSSPAAVPAA
jgi:hypothetical protein